MKKLFLLIMILMFTVNANAGQWDKDIPSDGDAKIDWPTDAQANFDALDRGLSNYRDNLKISYTSATAVTASTGEIVVSNAAGTVRLFLNNTSTTSITFADLDTGSEAAATYYVYAVAALVTSETATFKISASSTAPTGETYYKRIGSFVNNASLNIVNAHTLTNDSDLYALTLGDWVSKSIGTTYQATTDGIVTGYSKWTATGTGGVYNYECRTDSAAAPSTVRLIFSAGSRSGTEMTAGGSFPVKKGDYYNITKVTVVSGSVSLSEAMYFIPNE